MSNLFHPSITNIYGYQFDKNNAYLIMELMETNLWKFIQENHDKLSISELFLIMKKMTISVNYLSSKGIIHRDIRADNFLVSNNGKTVKITDFGISRVKENCQTSYMTNFKGNPIWQPKECHGRGKLKFSTKSDIYSLGMTFYQVIFNKNPFDGMTDKIKEYTDKMMKINQNLPIEVLQSFYVIPEMIKDGIRPIITSHLKVPKEFNDLLERMWKDKPNERITIEELMLWFKDNDEKFKKNLEKL